MPPKNSRKSSQKLVFSIPVLPGQRRQRHDPSRSFPVDLRCQHGSTLFTQVGLPFPVLQGSPRWFLTCQKPPERPPVHPGPSGIIPVSRFECVSGLSVYWPIIALGTRECGVAKLCRDPTVQSEFFLRVSLLKTLNLIYCYR